MFKSFLSSVSSVLSVSLKYIYIFNVSYDGHCSVIVLLCVILDMSQNPQNENVFWTVNKLESKFKKVSRNEAITGTLKILS